MPYANEASAPASVAFRNSDPGLTMCELISRRPGNRIDR
jgi:hypothetical protein